MDYVYFVFGIGPRVMTWIPEFIAILLAISIPFNTATNKQINLPFRYSFLIFLYLAHLGVGLFLNDVTGWTVLAGLRIYTKFIPIFLIPIIYPFSERAFKRIILFVIALTVIQLPVVLIQRFVLYATTLSGDRMGGTLGHSTSGVLSIYLIIMISFFVAFYFKEKISLSTFILLAGASFIPITLNETKISFILLPIAFLIPAFFIRGKRKTIFRVLLVMVVLVISFIVFKGVYDHFATKRWGTGIVGIVNDPHESSEIIGRRLDPILYAFTKAPFKDTRFVFFGRGAGNASEGFTRRLSGKYLNEAVQYGSRMTITKLVMELGIFGTILFFLFPFFVFLDSARLCRQEGLSGAYSLGMLSFVTFFTLSTFYTFTIDSNVLIFFFFLAAGQLVSLYSRADERTFVSQSVNPV